MWRNASASHEQDNSRQGHGTQAQTAVPIHRRKKSPRRRVPTRRGSSRALCALLCLRGYSRTPANSSMALRASAIIPSAINTWNAVATEDEDLLVFSLVESGVFPSIVFLVSCGRHALPAPREEAQPGMRRRRTASPNKEHLDAFGVFAENLTLFRCPREPCVLWGISLVWPPF